MLHLAQPRLRSNSTEFHRPTKFTLPHKVHYPNNQFHPPPDPTQRQEEMSLPTSFPIFCPTDSPANAVVNDPTAIMGASGNPDKPYEKVPPRLSLILPLPKQHPWQHFHPGKVLLVMIFLRSHFSHSMISQFSTATLTRGSSMLPRPLLASLATPTKPTETPPHG